jgi:hypothetical protein
VISGFGPCGGGGGRSALFTSNLINQSSNHAQEFNQCEEDGEEAKAKAKA